MKAHIDRIENGKTAVVVVKQIGDLLIPVKAFPFIISEGTHLTIELKQDSEDESKTKDAVKKLQDKLLHKPSEPDMK